MVRIEPKSWYEVRLTRPVTYAGGVIRPLHKVRIKGKALKAIVAKEGSDVVDTAERIQ